jgi:hypothetical protein
MHELASRGDIPERVDGRTPARLPGARTREACASSAARPAASLSCRAPRLFHGPIRVFTLAEIRTTTKARTFAAAARAGRAPFLRGQPPSMSRRGHPPSRNAQVETRPSSCRARHELQVRLDVWLTRSRTASAICRRDTWQLDRSTRRCSPGFRRRPCPRSVPGPGNSPVAPDSSTSGKAEACSPFLRKLGFGTCRASHRRTSNARQRRPSSKHSSSLVRSRGTSQDLHPGTLLHQALSPTCPESRRGAADTPGKGSHPKSNRVVVQRTRRQRPARSPDMWSSWLHPRARNRHRHPRSPLRCFRPARHSIRRASSRRIRRVSSRRTLSRHGSHPCCHLRSPPQRLLHARCLQRYPARPRPRRQRVCRRLHHRQAVCSPMCPRQESSRPCFHTRPRPPKARRRRIAHRVVECVAVLPRCLAPSPSRPLQKQGTCRSRFGAK